MPLLVASLVSAAALPAHAIGIGGRDDGTPVQDARRSVKEMPTLAPFAHILFCKKNPEDCRPDGSGRTVAPADAATMKRLREVNTAVNASIRATPDARGPLGDVWSLSPVKGDCDDYAVTKRHRLIAMGLPVGSLRLVVAMTQGGEGHAVLLAKTEQGDIVLDNRSSRLRSWRESGLTLLKIQSAEDPRRWVAGSSTLAARD